MSAGGSEFGGAYMAPLFSVPLASAPSNAQRLKPMRTLIGAIGSRDSRDHAIGALVGARLAADAPIAAAQVVVEDLSVDAAEVAERLSREWPRFDRVILVGAVMRDRPAGTIAAYRWTGELADEANDDALHDTLTSDGTSNASFDSTLVMLKRIADLPEEIVVVEVEPEVAEGESLTPAAAAAVERARILVRRLATNGRAVAGLPRQALGGQSHRSSLAD